MSACADHFSITKTHINFRCDQLNVGSAMSVNGSSGLLDEVIICLHACNIANDDFTMNAISNFLSMASSLLVSIANT
jgi:hypothetical protein|tara:strand:+ start:18674 stop:18904 length:231 start_codon:yes stop_codon:yes gene_type:complete